MLRHYLKSYAVDLVLITEQSPLIYWADLLCSTENSIFSKCQQHKPNSSRSQLQVQNLRVKCCLQAANEIINCHFASLNTAGRLKLLMPPLSSSETFLSNSPITFTISNIQYPKNHKRGTLNIFTFKDASERHCCIIWFIYLFSVFIIAWIF